MQHSAYCMVFIDDIFIFSKTDEEHAAHVEAVIATLNEFNLKMNVKKSFFGFRSLKVLGISCVVAESINGLFFRNCINYGLYPLECPGVATHFSEGDVAIVDYDTFEVQNATTGDVLQGRQFPEMLLDILRAEGIYPLMEAKGLLAPPNPETA